MGRRKKKKKLPIGAVVDTTPAVDPTPDLIAAGARQNDDGSFTVNDRFGRPFTGTPDEAVAALERGGSFLTGAQRGSATVERVTDSLGFGEGAEAVRAFGEGGADMLFPGLSRFVAQLIGEDTANLGRRAEASPFIRGSGQALGLGVGILSGGRGVGAVGAATPLGAATKAAIGIGGGVEKLAKARLGAGVARVLGLGTEGAIDGSLFSAGQEVVDAHLSNKPVAAESISGALLGGAAIGTGVGLAGGLLGQAGRLFGKRNHGALKLDDAELGVIGGAVDEQFGIFNQVRRADGPATVVSARAGRELAPDTIFVPDPGKTQAPKTILDELSKRPPAGPERFASKARARRAEVGSEAAEAAARQRARQFDPRRDTLLDSRLRRNFATDVGPGEPFAKATLVDEAATSPGFLRPRDGAPTLVDDLTQPGFSPEITKPGGLRFADTDVPSPGTRPGGPRFDRAADTLADGPGTIPGGRKFVTQVDSAVPAQQAAVRANAAEVKAASKEVAALEKKVAALEKKAAAQAQKAEAKAAGEAAKVDARAAAAEAKAQAKRASAALNEAENRAAELKAFRKELDATQVDVAIPALQAEVRAEAKAAAAGAKAEAKAAAADAKRLAKISEDVIADEAQLAVGFERIAVAEKALREKLGGTVNGKRFTDFLANKTPKESIELLNQYGQFMGNARAVLRGGGLDAFNASAKALDGTVVAALNRLGVSPSAGSKLLDALQVAEGVDIAAELAGGDFIPLPPEINNMLHLVAAMRIGGRVLKGKSGAGGGFLGNIFKGGVGQAARDAAGGVVQRAGGAPLAAAFARGGGGVAGRKFAGDVLELDAVKLINAQRNSEGRVGRAITNLAKVAQPRTVALKLTSAKFLKSFLADEKAPEKDPVTHPDKAAQAFADRMRTLRKLNGLPEAKIRRSHDLTKEIELLSPETAELVRQHYDATLSFLTERAPLPPPETETLFGSVWAPSPQQISEFLDFYEGAVDPVGTIERLRDGTITPQHMEAVRELHPGHFELTRQVVFENRAKLVHAPPDTKYRLSMFLQLTLDPLMNTLPGLQQVHADVELASSQAQQQQRPSLPQGGTPTLNRPSEVQEKAQR